MSWNGNTSWNVGDYPEPPAEPDEVPDDYYLSDFDLMLLEEEAEDE